MPGLQLLLFLIYLGKTNKGWWLKLLPPPPPTFQIRDKLDNIFFWKLHVFKVMYSYSY